MTRDVFNHRYAKKAATQATPIFDAVRRDLGWPDNRVIDLRPADRDQQPRQGGDDRG